MHRIIDWNEFWNAIHASSPDRFEKDREVIPEGAWVRLEGRSNDGTSFRGTLLNEPYSDFGVHEGKLVTVRFAEDEERRFLVTETGS